MQPLQKAGASCCRCHLALQCATFVVETQAEGFASLKCPAPSDLADALDAWAGASMGGELMSAPLPGAPIKKASTPCGTEAVSLLNTSYYSILLLPYPPPVPHRLSRPFRR